MERILRKREETKLRREVKLRNGEVLMLTQRKVANG